MFSWIAYVWWHESDEFEFFRWLTTKRTFALHTNSIYQIDGKQCTDNGSDHFARNLASLIRDPSHINATNHICTFYVLRCDDFATLSVQRYMIERCWACPVCAAPLCVRWTYCIWLHCSTSMSKRLRSDCCMLKNVLICVSHCTSCYFVRNQRNLLHIRNRVPIATEPKMRSLFVICTTPSWYCFDQTGIERNLIRLGRISMCNDTVFNFSKIGLQFRNALEMMLKLQLYKIFPLSLVYLKV